MKVYLPNFSNSFVGAQVVNIEVCAALLCGIGGESENVFLYEERVN